MIDFLMLISVLWNTAFKKFEVIWSVLTDHITSDFLNAVLNKYY